MSVDRRVWLAIGGATAILGAGAIGVGALAWSVLGGPGAERLDSFVEAGHAPAFAYVSVAAPTASGIEVDPSVLVDARGHIEDRFDDLDGVLLAPEEGDVPGILDRIQRRQIAGYYVETTVQSLETLPDGALRARVSVLLETYPGRDIRGMMAGNATVRGATGIDAQRAAIEGALDGALRGVESTLH